MKILFRVCEHVKQRYLLVVMCMLGHAFAVMNRHAFVMTMEDMVFKERMDEDEKRKPACPLSKKIDKVNLDIEEFSWSESLQLTFISAMSVGMYLGMLPVGLATDRYGAKTLFGLSVFIPGICCLLTPICARTSTFLLLLNRVVTGTFEAAQYPTVAWLGARWFPVRQQGVMLSIVFLGNSFGHLVAEKLTPSWSSHFYVLAGLSTLWSYFWQLIICEDPFQHPFITLEELEMLVDKIPMYATDTELEPGWKWPWKAILTSKSLLILMVGHLGYSLFSNFTLFIIPGIFFPEIHSYDLKHHHGLVFFSDLMMAFSIMTSGFISDKMIHARWLNTTHVIKTFYSISTITGSLLLLGLVHVGCSTTSALLYYLATVVCLGFGQTNWSHACLHLAPNFVGVCMAISSILSVLVMPLQLYSQQVFTENGRVNEWKTVSYMNAAVSILMAAIFLKWGNCQLRPWNLPQKKTPTFEVDYEKQENPGEGERALGKDELPDKSPPGVSGQSATKLAMAKSRSQIRSRGRDEEFGVLELTPSMRFDKVKRVSTMVSPPRPSTGGASRPEEERRGQRGRDQRGS